MLILDDNLPKHLAPWLNTHFPDSKTVSTFWIGFGELPDAAIYKYGREKKAIILTKDIDYVHLYNRLGPPPSILHLTIGNCHKGPLRAYLLRTLPEVFSKLANGETFIELG